MFLSQVVLFFTYFFPLVALVLAYYFSIYFPAKLENDRQVYLQKKIKVGDRVATVGGLIGTVLHKDRALVQLTLFDGATVEVELESICKKF